MSMTLAQQQDMVKAMYELEKSLACATMSRRVYMVMVEALREKLCFTKEDVEELVNKFAKQHADSIRDELGMEYRDGMFMPAGVSSTGDLDRN